MKCTNPEYGVDNTEYSIFCIVCGHKIYTNSASQKKCRHDLRANWMDAEEQYELSEKCYCGDGVKQSDDKAVQWFRKAAE